MKKSKNLIESLDKLKDHDPDQTLFGQVYVPTYLEFLDIKKPKLRLIRNAKK